MRQRVGRRKMISGYTTTALETRHMTSGLRELMTSGVGLTATERWQLAHG